MLGEAEQLPFDLRREVAQDGLVGGMDAERGAGEDHARRKRRHFGAVEIAAAFECR